MESYLIEDGRSSWYYVLIKFLNHFMFDKKNWSTDKNDEKMLHFLSENHNTSCDFKCLYIEIPKY